MERRPINARDVIRALGALGGARTWKEIRDRVRTDRKDAVHRYKYFDTEVNHYIQLHCEGYEKFNGKAYFRKVGRDRVEMIQPAPRRPSPRDPATSVPDMSVITWNDVDILILLTSEGRRKLVRHLNAERKPSLIKAKKASVLAATGKLICE